jgi:N-methylhydantoinase A
MYRIGIDVGGTFTDVVGIDDAGHVTIVKTMTTPNDPTLGALDGLARLAETLGVDLALLLQDTARIVHGTTVATNALLERKGAKVGMVTTEGHRDIIEMREGLKDARYDLRLPPPEPLVPRARRLSVQERVRADGSVAVPLDRRSLARAIAGLRRVGVEAVAVCLLHSYRRPDHEIEVGRTITDALPDVHVSLSCEILPQIKEYERFSTTVVNAYVSPVVAGYLERLERRLAEAGYQQPILVMQSHGGVARVAEAAKLAAASVLSGPAGGVAGARHAARLAGLGDAIAFDMGGTSTDISLLGGGAVSLEVDRRVAGVPVALPSLDIFTVGAGGGSIAHVAEGGLLQVGPQSARADPGPACYGKGGTEPTVTDASLVLGYLDPKHFLGGRMVLDRDAAERAVDDVAKPLGLSLEATAEGIHRVVNARMADGIRLASVRRGVDPRAHAIISFGGAAGLHVTAVARELEITRIIVPRVASVLSAWGMLATDLRYEAVRSHVDSIGRVSDAAVHGIFRNLEVAAHSHLIGFDGEVRIERGADMRYGEQIFEIAVSLDGIAMEDDGLLARITERFHARHEELFTYSAPDHEVVLVNIRVAAVGMLPALPVEPALPESDAVPPIERRRVWLNSWLEVNVYELETLARDQLVRGPAILESPTTTILVRHGDQARRRSLGWLEIDVPASKASESHPRSADPNRPV